MRTAIRLFSLLLAGMLTAYGQMTMTGHVLNSAQQPLANGTISFQPVTNKGVPMSFQLPGGQSTKGIVSATVTNGAFTVSLPDTDLTQPQHVCFRVTSQDPDTQEQLYDNGYSCLQPASSAYWCNAGAHTCNFDAYIPDQAPMALVQSGPKGDKGDQGVQGIQGIQGPVGPSLNPRGAWSSGTSYNVGDMATYNGCSYARVVAGTTSTVPSADLTNWQTAQCPVDTQALSSGIFAAALPKNILNAANVTVGKFVDPTNGTTPTGSTGYTTWGITGLMTVAPGEPFRVNFPLTHVNSGVGLAYYLNGTYITGLDYGTSSDTYNTSTVFTVPAGVNQLQMTIPGPFTAGNLMVWTGKTAPPSYMSYNVTQLDSALSQASTNATNIATNTGTLNSTNMTLFAKNLLNTANVVVGKYVNPADGTTPTAAGGFSTWGVTGLIPIAAGQNFRVNFPLTHVNSGVGMAFYNNGVFVAGSGLDYGTSSDTYSTSTIFTMPAGANQVQLTIPGPFTASTLMVVAGTTPPAIYQPYNSSLVDTLNASAGTVSAAVAANTAAINSIVSSGMPSLVPKNLFNPSTYTALYYVQIGGGVVAVAGGSGGAYANYAATDYIPIAPGQQFMMNFPLPAVGSGSLASGIAYFDINNNYVTGVAYANNPANYVWTAPAGVAKMRLTLPFSSAWVPANQMVYTGSVAPPVIVPYGKTLADIVSISAGNPLYGKKVAIFGDSICQQLGHYWENQLVAKYGVIIVYQNCHGGRKTQNIFEDYGGGAGNGTFTSSAWTSGNGYTGETVGNTLAQDLAAAAPDVIFVGLSTNDGGTTLGTSSDTSTTASFYGYVLNAIDKLTSVAPTARLMWTSMYGYNAAAYQGGTGGTYTVNSALLTAIQTVAGKYGVPVCDMLNNSGINVNTWASALGDGIHINPTGADKYYLPTLVACARRLVY